MSALVPVPYYGDDVAEFAIRDHDTLALFFFFKAALSIQDLLCFHTNFRIMCSSFERHSFGILIEIALSLWITLVIRSF